MRFNIFKRNSDLFMEVLMLNLTVGRFFLSRVNWVVLSISSPPKNNEYILIFAFEFEV